MHIQSAEGRLLCRNCISAIATEAPYTWLPEVTVIRDDSVYWYIYIENRHNHHANMQVHHIGPRTAITHLHPSKPHHDGTEVQVRHADFAPGGVALAHTRQVEPRVHKADEEAYHAGQLSAGRSRGTVEAGRRV